MITPWWLPLIGLLGALALAWAAGLATSDSRLRTWILASYALRLLIAVIFFAASAWHWPVLASLQVPSEPGFWMFAIDSKVYHYYGVQIAAAWAHGFELPNPDLGFEYFAVVAALYRLLGPHPLYPIVLSAWLAALNGVLAYRIGLRLAHRKAALLGAMLVVFWPSSLLWSALLLKDALSWFLVWFSLWLVMEMLTATDRSRRVSALRQLGCAIGLFCAVGLLTALRFYIGSALALATLMVVGVGGITACVRRHWVVGARALVCTALVISTVLLSRTVDTKKLLSPANPEAAHFQWGMKAWRGGLLEEAVEEFRRACQLQPRYYAAYLGAGAIQIQQRAWDPAIDTYRQYLEQQPPPAQRFFVERLLARLYVERGNMLIQQGGDGELRALEAYQHAIEFDPAFPDGHANLGIAVARYHRNFTRAFELIHTAWTLAQTDEEYERLRRMLGHLYTIQGDYEVWLNHPVEAVAAYEQAIRWNPTDGFTHAKLAFGLVDQRLDIRRGLTIAERAATLAVGDTALETTRLAARVYTITAIRDMHEGKISEALAAYGRAASLDDRNLPALIATANALVAKGHLATAFDLGERALQEQLRKGDEAKRRQLLANERLVNLAAQAVFHSPAVRPLQVTEPWETAAAFTEVQQSMKASAATPVLFGHTSEEMVHLALAVFPEDKKEVSLHAGALTGRHSGLTLAQFREEAVLSFSETTPAALNERRRGFIASGGYSLTDAWVKIATPGALLTYLPRALAVGFLAPFPWQWGDAKGSTGVMRSFAGIEMLLVYLLLPGVVGGAVRLISHRKIDGLFLLAFILSMAVPISLVVANLGTLFRLRLLFLLPLLVVAACGDPLGFYQQWWRRLRGGLVPPAPSDREDGTPDTRVQLEEASTR